MFDGLKGGQPVYLGYNPTQNRPFIQPAATSMLYQQYAGASIPGIKLSSVKSGLNQQTSELINMQSGIQNTYYSAVNEMQNILKENNFDMQKAQNDDRWNGSLEKLEEAKMYQDTFEKANKQIEYNKKYQISLMGNIKKKGSGNGMALTNDNRRMFLYSDPSGGIHVGREGEENGILSGGGDILFKDGENLISSGQLEKPEIAIESKQYYLTNTDYANALEEISMLDLDGEVKKPVDIMVYGGDAWRKGLDTYLRDASNKFIGSARGGYGIGVGDAELGQNPGVRFVQNYYNSYSSNIGNLINAATSVFNSLTDEQQKSALGQYYNENPNGDKDGFTAWFTQKAVDKMETLKASDSKVTTSLGAGAELLAGSSPKTTNIQTSYAITVEGLRASEQGKKIPGVTTGNVTFVRGDDEGAYGETTKFAKKIDTPVANYMNKYYREQSYNSKTGKKTGISTLKGVAYGLESVGMVMSQEGEAMNIVKFPKEIMENLKINKFNNEIIVMSNNPFAFKNNKGVIGKSLRGSSSPGEITEDVPFISVEVYANDEIAKQMRKYANKNQLKMMAQSGSYYETESGNMVFNVLIPFPENPSNVVEGETHQTPATANARYVNQTRNRVNQ